MEDELPNAYQQRPLRDLGVYPALLLSRLLLAVLNRDSGAPLTRQEFNDVVRRPDDGMSAALGTLLRCGAWMMVAVAALAVFVPTAFLRSATASHLHPVPLALMTVSAFVSTFASMAILPALVRVPVAFILDERVERRLRAAAVAGGRPRGFVVRLAIPSHIDTVFAALMAMAITAALYEGFVAVPG